MLTADDYRKGNGVFYEPPPSRGYLTLKVLEFLNGCEYDDLALRYIHSVQPTTIRVSKGCICSDSWRGRVTVFLKEDNKTINYIEQEVEITGSNGYDLDQEFFKKYGRYPQR